MKQILITVLIWFLFFPMQSKASTSSIPFTHKTLYGTWKKQIGSKPEEPLYVSFLRNYGLPDPNGTFFDSAKVAVLEPPKDQSSYPVFLDFLSPKPFNGDKSVRMENDPLSFFETTLGGAKGKVIRGTGRMIYNNNLYPTTNMIAKGYYFDTKKGIIEILVQIRSVKGDIIKIEQDVDDLINSFRFGLPEDIALIRLLEMKSPDTVPVVLPKQSKPMIPKVILFYILGLAGIVILILVAIKIMKRIPKKKLTKKQRRKNNRSKVS
jgi:hypothetical protein